MCIPSHLRDKSALRLLSSSYNGAKIIHSYDDWLVINSLQSMSSICYWWDIPGNLFMHKHALTLIQRSSWQVNRNTRTCRHMRASLSRSWESSALWRSISPSRCLSSSLSSRPEEGPLGNRWKDKMGKKYEGGEERRSESPKGAIITTQNFTHTSTSLQTFWMLTHTQKWLEPTCVKPSLTSFPPSTPCWRLLIWSLKEITWETEDRMGNHKAI